MRLLKEKTRINEKCHVNLNSKIGILSYYYEQVIRIFKHCLFTLFLRCLENVISVISARCYLISMFFRATIVKCFVGFAQEMNILTFKVILLP